MFTRIRGITAFEIIVVLFIIAIIVAIALPGYLKARVTPSLNACVENLKKIDGETPTAAMLPIVNSYEPEAATAAKDYIESYLSERNRFEFADKALVDKAVAGVNLGKSSGLTPSQSAAIGRELGVDYVLHGTMAIRKTHTSSGWRNDVKVSVRIYDTKIGEKYSPQAGKEVGSWSSTPHAGVPTSGMDFFAKTLAENAASDVCAKMIAGTY